MYFMYYLNTNQSMAIGHFLGNTTLVVCRCIVRKNSGKSTIFRLIRPRPQSNLGKSHQKEQQRQKTRITSHLPPAVSKWSPSTSVRPGRPILRPSLMASTGTTPRPPPSSRTMSLSSARTGHSIVTPTWPC